ncbi:hypothetical protein [Streptomyces sp. A1136]|uniref:hypothetical protein n=1 Tax=Streptomyces sp. A1136 TaxID=2563102 RepID=UPI00109E83CF|nr:hypothetical protein [Streptomyces sp. A1136]THA47508.1 hypothetical protein E6R62_31345 [Streptomyces sp. A1136]
MDIDPEMHMYDCPGTLPGGRGCETCKDWEGRTFADIRAELAGTRAPVPEPRSAPSEPEPARTLHHAGYCERLAYEGGICTCHSPDDYFQEPPNMADLEDGVDARW